MSDATRYLKRRAMLLQRMLDDGQAQTSTPRRARAPRIDSKEPLGHTRNQLLGDTDAGVLDFEDSAAGDPLPAYLDLTRLGCESDRIVDQIIKNRMQLRLVSEQSRVLIDAQVDRDAGYGTRELFTHRFQHPGYVDEIVASLSIHRLQPRELEHVLDQAPR